jgi:hypothetical protein
VPRDPRRLTSRSRVAPFPASPSPLRSCLRSGTRAAARRPTARLSGAGPRGAGEPSPGRRSRACPRLRREAPWTSSQHRSPPCTCCTAGGWQVAPTVASSSPNAAIRSRPNGQGVGVVAPCAGRAPATRSLHLPLEAPAAPPDSGPPQRLHRQRLVMSSRGSTHWRPSYGHHVSPFLCDMAGRRGAAANAWSRELPDSAVPSRPSWLGLLVAEPRLHGRAGPQGAPQAAVERTGFAGA